MADDAKRAEVTILLVDDNEQILRSVPRLFHRLPVRVRCAKCASEALALLQQEQVDLLISDFNMPGLNGLALLEQVRARWPQVRSVLNSGDGQAVTAARSQGFAAVLKPEANDLLLDLVAKAIEQKPS